MNFLPSDKLLNNFAPLKPVLSCHNLFAHQADDAFALWDEWEKESGSEREIPFWGVVWPAGICLARYLINNKYIIEGKSVLDIGCGGGIPAIAAAKSGASCVTANDIDPVALYITSLNTKANNVTITTDCRNLLEDATPNAPYDVILAADMFYQRSNSKLMFDFLNKYRKQGSTVLIADAQRTYAPKTEITLLNEEYVAVNKDLEGMEKRNVRLFLLNN